ncbi:O-methyltransferase 1, chloroplastic isoform X1 [Magnolia sinica]|uniref:O-methyltransferase 1, chloroplastic isoform X1 n=1 Tax=Magnolia sinica TaxID=86752 RepID=UPI00265AC3A6|nr:O-methyltransferase 1, chloroplastic isoform X1 [Magnolia sinica]
MGTALLPSSPPLICCSTNGHKGRRFGGPRAKLEFNGDDPFLQAAIRAASLRFQETHRPDPLFIDPYVSCFIPPSSGKNTKQISASTASPCHYCLATKFIDDKLLSTANHMDGVRQIVLLTDGMDTRPYRLKWPHSTIIFDISPGRIFTIASERLKGVGAKISRTSMFIHVPLESHDIQAILQSKGFNGNRPSIWALQGLPVMTLASFKEIISVVSSLAMKGSIFLGEMPSWLAKTEVGIKVGLLKTHNRLLVFMSLLLIYVSVHGPPQSNTQKWMDKLFMSNGFRLGVIAYNDVAKDVLRDPPSGDYGNILFVAEQLQLSDDQMESWRREFQRMEEEGDEDGFEEL